MHYVICPECKSEIEIPPDAVGPDRTDPWNVIGCVDCGITFDYDDEEVITDNREDPLFF
jgi:Zn ribbon nucleic-acid-binding protein